LAPEIALCRYLTVREVRTIVRRSDETIYRWIEDNVFPNATKIKGGWLIPESDLHALLDREPHTDTVWCAEWHYAVPVGGLASGAIGAARPFGSNVFPQKL
jgi:excisionase family DNA binding protein